MFLSILSGLSGCSLSDSATGIDIAAIQNVITYSFNSTYYVRPPGSGYGSGDGSDWANAFTDLPADLKRGARYYLAGGNYDTATASALYVDHSFADAEQGSQYIGIIKATAADHGTNTGWNAAFATNAAILGPLSFTTGYYVLDGQSGSGTQGYGIKIASRDTADEVKVIRFGWDSQAHHILLNHLELVHNGNPFSNLQGLNCGLCFN